MHLRYYCSCVSLCCARSCCCCCLSAFCCLCFAIFVFGSWSFLFLLTLAHCFSVHYALCIFHLLFSAKWNQIRLTNPTSQANHFGILCIWFILRTKIFNIFFASSEFKFKFKYIWVCMFFRNLKIGKTLKTFILSQTIAEIFQTEASDDKQFSITDLTKWTDNQEHLSKLNEMLPSTIRYKICHSHELPFYRCARYVYDYC